MSLKQIDNKLKTFTTNKEKLQQLGHEIAMMVFRHAAPTEIPDCVGSGDCSRILALANAMPKSWMVQLDAWVKQFSPMRFSVSNGKYGYDSKYKLLETKAEKLEWWNIEGANSTPFYDLDEPDQEIVLMDDEKLLGFVLSLSKRIAKSVKDGKVAPDAIPTATALVDALSHINAAELKTPVNDDKPATPPVEVAA